jgi:hypothetical protein
MKKKTNKPGSTEVSLLTTKAKATPTPRIEKGKKHVFGGKPGRVAPPEPCK